MFKLIINNIEKEFKDPIKAIKLVNDSNILAICLDNKVHDLNYIIKNSGKIKFIYKQDEDGQLIYRRTLDFIFIYAMHKLYNADVYFSHSFAKGQYIRVENIDIDKIDIESVKNYMLNVIKQDLPIIRKVVTKQEAVAFFDQHNKLDCAQLLNNRNSNLCSIYQLDDIYDYFYGVMLPSCSYIDKFSIAKVHDGIWLASEDIPFVDQPKLFEIFNRFEKNGLKNDLSCINDLNNNISIDQKKMISIAEKRFNDDIRLITNKIITDPNIKLILISGPSSSGKTTFSKILEKMLSASGLKCLCLSLDDFFKERQDSPRLQDGSYDYENIDCIDLSLFNKCMNDLINNKGCYLPTFDFIDGKKIFSKEATYLNNDQILIIEGLHALNPLTTQNIADKYKYKIYINALTHLNFDKHNYISTSDYRLIRRMTRDYKFRGQSVTDTIKQWPKVKDGENKYIYPYQEEADSILNTSLEYELAIFKKILMPLLLEVDKDLDEYLLANRIKHILEYVNEADESLVPDNSILREFIGH